MKRLPPLIPVLAAACALFIGILIYAYIETKKANPQMLDEHGRVVHSSYVKRGAANPVAPA
jgi:hypothetical protein